MLSCKEATRLLSEKLDHELTLWQRMSLRMHVMMCSACRAYGRQLAILNRLIPQYFHREQAAVEPPAEHLSPEARQRMKELVRDRAG
jgi:predicted anti-sigma-YlaC factor YlaD